MQVPGVEILACSKVIPGSTRFAKIAIRGKHNMLRNDLTLIKDKYVLKGYRPCLLRADPVSVFRPAPSSTGGLMVQCLRGYSSLEGFASI